MRQKRRKILCLWDAPLKRQLNCDEMIMLIRCLLGQLLFPVECAFWRIRFLLGKYQRLRIQKCYFYGPQEFISIATKAMDMLRDLDRPVYDGLVRGKYVFWDEPVGGVSFESHCGIPRGFSSWKEQGIIVCVIQSYMGTKLARLDRSVLRRNGKEWQASTHRRVYSATRAWLEQHGFPNELVNCFPKEFAQ
jgi:hypothetical protein